MKTSLITTLAVISLTGCGLNPYAGERQAAQKRDRPYQESFEALEDYRASTECENPQRIEVLAKITELERDVSNYQSMGLDYMTREARERHISMAFDFADEALRRWCLDDADRVYRRLIDFYVGWNHSGIRDRARLGVEDVRDLRENSRTTR